VESTPGRKGRYLSQPLIASIKISHFNECKDGGSICLSWACQEVIMACKRQWPSPGVGMIS
jgi:hypothetical protein